jgi:hypothetical protein
VKFPFTVDTARGSADLEAMLDISGGDPGDKYTPPSGPDIEVQSKLVYRADPKHPLGPYYYRNYIYAVRGLKKRLLPAEVADKIGAYLIEKRFDDILEYQYECNRRD